MKRILNILRHIGPSSVALFTIACVIWLVMNYVNVNIPLKTRELIDSIILKKHFDANLFETLVFMYLFVVA